MVKNHEWLPRHHYQLLMMGIERVKEGLVDACDDYLGESLGA
jgi:hypothetical protein